ncbi:MAG: non-heme iron oxygenase ferredoxin subunit [Saccharothrix sp.]|nr:non-heme iron oxygenase ferredoxin subunit [Saccharothrix sp.]
MNRVCSLAELDDRKPVAFEVGDEYTPVVLVRDGGTVHALHDLCSHAAIELSEGEVTRKGIECHLHGSCFDLRTGKPSSPPATEPVDVFAVDIRDGDVFVDVTVTLN